MTYFWGLFAITVMIVITQTITTWQVFDSFSKIEKGWLKNIQSIMFCSILSGTMIIFVLKGIHWVAFVAALMEVLINFYYYAEDFWRRGLPAFQGTIKDKQEKKRASILRFWRKYWLKMLFGVVIPSIIYLCSYYMKEG